MPLLIRIERFRTVTPVKIIHGFDMMYKACCSKEKVPYCFPRSSVKFHGHVGQTIIDFYPNWAFPDC